jgi:GTP cyclohydrolase I
VPASLTAYDSDRLRRRPSRLGPATRERRLRREIDLPGAQRAAQELLRALGADLDAAGLQDTPRRMADAYAELLTAQPFKATTFPNIDGTTS